jgi:hypothetical protein
VGFLLLAGVFLLDCFGERGAIVAMAVVIGVVCGGGGGVWREGYKKVHATEFMRQ